MTMTDTDARPPAGLRERFGPKAHRLYRMAAGELWTPLDPCKPEEPVQERRILDDPENDSTRLLFLIKQLLHPMLIALAGRAQAPGIARKEAPALSGGHPWPPPGTTPSHP